MGDNGIRIHMKKSMSFSKSSLAAYKAISPIYLMVSKIYLCRFMRLNIDQITVYQSLFINKANVNRGSRYGMTCSLAMYTLFTAIPLTYMSPVFENCKIQIKFQVISEKLKHQKISEN